MLWFTEIKYFFDFAAKVQNLYYLLYMLYLPGTAVSSLQSPGLSLSTETKSNKNNIINKIKV